MNLPQPTTPINSAAGLAGILAVIETDMIARGFRVSLSPTSVTISSGDRAFRLAAADLEAAPAAVPSGPIAGLLMRTRARPVSGGSPAEDAADARRLDERIAGLDVEFPIRKSAADLARDRLEILQWYREHTGA